MYRSAPSPNVRSLQGITHRALGDPVEKKRNVTFSKQGLILRAMLMRMALMWASSIWASIRDRPLIASSVIRSSRSSLSSMPAIMADNTVVEWRCTYTKDNFLRVNNIKLNMKLYAMLWTHNYVSGIVCIQVSK